MKQIIILLCSILLISCSSRKVIVEKIKKDSLVTINSKIVTDEIYTSETKNDIITNELTIEPLDTLKDIVINGISYRNVVLRYKNTKDNSLHRKEKIVSKKEDIKQTVKTSNKVFKKNIDKKANYFIYLWLLLIPLILFLFKKLKQSIFF